MGCHFLLQGIFPAQGSNLGLPNCRQTLYCQIKGDIIVKSSHGYGCDHRLEKKVIFPPNILRRIIRRTLRRISSVQFISVPQTCPTLCDPMTRQASLSITKTQSLPKPMSIESVMPSSHLIFHCPLLLLTTIPPSIRVFSNESALHIRLPKYRSFSFSISPFK